MNICSIFCYHLKQKKIKFHASALPAFLEGLGLESTNLTFNDLCLIIEESLKPIMA